MKRNIFLLLTSILLFSCQSGRNDNSYLYKKFIKGNDTIPYRIMYPKNYKPNTEYPLILVLHGAGERGNDNNLQLNHGASLFQSDSLRDMYKAIVLFPQCPKNIMWTHRVKTIKDEKINFQFPLCDGPTWPTKLVNDLVDSLVNIHEIDSSRLYIGGLSMGGIGTLEFLQRWPDKYAAAFVICGGNDSSLVKDYKNTPIWFFHGGKDDVVPNRYSKQVYYKMKSLNPQTKSKYTLYPNDNHNSWDDAFSEPGLYEWLFSFVNIQNK